MTMCPEADYRAGLSDIDFWTHVFQHEEEERRSYISYLWAFESPDAWVIDCVRCGLRISVDEETAHERERDAFCDNCAEETLPDLEETV